LADRLRPILTFSSLGRSQARRYVTHSLSHQQRNLLSSELEPSAIWNALCGDWVFRPAWIDACNPESLTATAELLAIVVCTQPECLGKHFETQPFRIECGPIGEGDRHAKREFEALAKINAQSLFGLNRQSMAPGHGLAPFQHFALKLLAERRHQVSWGLCIRHDFGLDVLGP
jgi:hypothetical protein